MTGSSSLARPEIQAELLADALRSASVGFLVRDEDLRYVAANEVACEILGTSLEALLGQRVGEHTEHGDDAIDDAIQRGFAIGPAVVQRFDGSGQVEVFYATFTTRPAGMPFMATMLAPLSPAS